MQPDLAGKRSRLQLSGYLIYATLTQHATQALRKLTQENSRAARTKYLKEKRSRTAFFQYREKSIGIPLSRLH
jgi:hypothetical protein